MEHLAARQVPGWELEDEAFLLMHLRMTGTLLYDAPPARPTSVRWTLDDGHELRFCDPRRFGTGELALGAAARDTFFATRLGLEPLDGALTGEALRRMARGRRAPVKAFLLDQRRIAGVGNIYADEALFGRGIHPLRPVGTLTRAQCDALRSRCARRSRPASAGGATIDDFRHVDGVQGAFQNEFLAPAPGRAARGARRRWSSSSPRGAGRTRAEPPAARGAGALGGLRGELGQAPLWSACTSCWKPPTDVADHDCGSSTSRSLDELRASSRVLCQIDLDEVELADPQQLLRPLAERARLSRVDSDLGHYFTNIARASWLAR